MKAVAELLGQKVLRGLSEDDILSSSAKIRAELGDRAFLRAVHFIRENIRVEKAKDRLRDGDIKGFLEVILSSGNSSFKYLQNVYTNQKPDEQGLSLALCLADGYLEGKESACRVHGGGFAGTIQAFVKKEHLDGYVALMDSVFGKGAAMPLDIRPLGAVKLF